MTGPATIRARMFFAAVFCALMTALGLSAVCRCVKLHLVPEPSQLVRGNDIPVVTSFKAAYPFDGESGETMRNAPAEPEKRTPRLAWLRVADWMKKSANEYSMKQNPLMKPFHLLVCRLDEKIGNNIIENGNLTIVRLPDGVLSYAFNGSGSPETLDAARDFAAWLKARNIPCMLILAANKMDDSMTDFPACIPPGYSRRMKQYLALLAEDHIPYLDAKSELLAADRDFFRWFYRTDHHWNVFAGRLVAEATAKKLHDELKVTADAGAIRETNFKLARYPAIFMGSMAFKAGAAPEDLEVFYPRKASSFHLRIPDLGIDRTGGFEDTLIAQRYLKSATTYNCFLYASRPLIQIENKNCSSGTRVCVLKHSQANVLCTYLAYSVQYLDMIDPRYFDGNIKSFIRQTKPDAVLICL